MRVLPVRSRSILTAAWKLTPPLGSIREGRAQGKPLLPRLERPAGEHRESGVPACPLSSGLAVETSAGVMPRF